MLGTLVRRVGFWLIIAALLLAVAPTFFQESPHQLLKFGETWPRNLAIAGVLLFALGWVLGRVSRKCPRCGRPSAGTSVFCSFHRNELSRMGREARDRNRREHRSW